jgi:hypothetical protein
MDYFLLPLAAADVYVSSPFPYVRGHVFRSKRDP